MGYRKIITIAEKHLICTSIRGRSLQGSWIASHVIYGSSVGVPVRVDSMRRLKTRMRDLETGECRLQGIRAWWANISLRTIISWVTIPFTDLTTITGRRTKYTIIWAIAISMIPIAVSIAIIAACTLPEIAITIWKTRLATVLSSHESCLGDLWWNKNLWFIR